MYRGYIAKKLKKIIARVSIVPDNFLSKEYLQLATIQFYIIRGSFLCYFYMFKKVKFF